MPASLHSVLRSQRDTLGPAFELTIKRLPQTIFTHMRLLTDIHEHRELLKTLVARNLKIRYKRSVLGFFWTLLNPLFLILIYAVFLKILRFYNSTDELFLPKLVTGIIVWQFLAMSLGDALYAVLGNANLVTKTAFPRIVLPLSTALADLVNFLLSLLILVVYVLVIGVDCYSFAGMLPVIILTQFALCLGLALLISAANVFFRDTEHLLGVILLAWFFLTPIIYSVQDIPPRFQRLAFINPMTGIVTAYRTVFLSTDIMAPRLVLLSMLIAWGVCLLGIVVFRLVEDRFSDEL